MLAYSNLVSRRSGVGVTAVVGQVAMTPLPATPVTVDPATPVTAPRRP